jgi:hypothetical protein
MNSASKTPKFATSRRVRQIVASSSRSDVQLLRETAYRGTKRCCNAKPFCLQTLRKCSPAHRASLNTRSSRIVRRMEMDDLVFTVPPVNKAGGASPNSIMDTATTKQSKMLK